MTGQWLGEQRETSAHIRQITHFAVCADDNLISNYKELYIENPIPIEPTDASSITIAPKQIDERVIATTHWSDYGFKVLPCDPMSKKLFASDDEKQSGFTQEAFQEHLDQFPTHQPAIVLDCTLVAITAHGPDKDKVLGKYAQNLGLSVPPQICFVDQDNETMIYKLPDGKTLPATIHRTDGIKTLRENDLVLLPKGKFIKQCSLQQEGLNDIKPLCEDDLGSIINGERLDPAAEKVTELNDIAADTGSPIIKPNRLTKYSLKGYAATLEQQAEEATPVLGSLALKGQATMFYASPNTGKTLISLYLLDQAVREGWIIPECCYYANFDDTLRGLAEKLRILEETGAHVLATGQHGFEAGKLLSLMLQMIQLEECRGVLLILDTVKKVVSLMDKKESSAFAEIVRQFVMQGGTVVGLAHTNKRPGPDGKPIYSGTSDLVDDFDCAYIMSEIQAQTSSGDKVIEFENIKRRGDNPKFAHYCYASETGISYEELLASVRMVDPADAESLQQQAQTMSDADVIAIAETSITDGINTKMSLADDVRELASISKRAAVQLIDRYTGDDPEKHRWQYSVAARGAKVYALLPRPVAPAD